MSIEERVLDSKLVLITSSTELLCGENILIGRENVIDDFPLFIKKQKYN